MRAIEAEKGHQERMESGFYERYMSGIGLDIGYRGYNGADETVLPTAIGVDLDYSGYDGITLPFADNSQDYVFASHVLEHIDNHFAVIKDWFRVVKLGGHLIIALPHQDLYEKQEQFPSKYCDDHKRFYTSWSALWEIAFSLQVNSYRIVSLREIDTNYNYNKPNDPVDATYERYEIELVLRKRF